MIRQDILCGWFGLPAGMWPPDHYRLLGLRPGESDTRLIEQRVQRRMEEIRCYQMLHPEQASEGMNRLAEALVCLTDPRSKADYDRSLLGKEWDTVVENVRQHDTKIGKSKSGGIPAPPPPVPPPQEGAAKLPCQPPPLPPGYAPTPEPSPSSLKGIGDETAVEAVPRDVGTAKEECQALNARSESAPRIDPIVEAARAPVAWKGLGTCHALRRRITLTSKLLSVWLKLEPFCGCPEPLANRAQARLLTKLLGEIGTVLEDFPPILGKAGQPGCLVAMLADQEIVTTFQKLDAAQRAALNESWQAGRQLLETHAQLLQDELRARRSQSLGKRLCRVASLDFGARPGFLLLFLVLLVANLILWLGYARGWVFSP